MDQCDKQKSAIGDHVQPHTPGAYVLRLQLEVRGRDVEESLQPSSSPDIGICCRKSLHRLGNQSHFQVPVIAAHPTF